MTACPSYSPPSVRCAVSSSLSITGRDFDEIIINFLQEEFQRRTKIDVRGNFKAYLKLAAAAEKAKKTLSPLGVSEAAISVECLANDIDLQCVLTRDEFEKRMNVLVKVRHPSPSLLPSC